MEHGQQSQGNSMNNIKNFKPVNLTKELLDEFKNSDGYTPLILQSQDGKYWHDCYDLFSNDTIKIMYDNDGVIRSVVDAPVPSRGGIYAVSMFYPLNMSVAEVDVLPDEFELESEEWVYDGQTIFKSLKLIADRSKIANVAELYHLSGRASSYLLMLQSSESSGTTQAGDGNLILELQQYLAELRYVDLTLRVPSWPTAPSFMC